MISCLTSTTAVNDINVVTSLEIYPNPTTGLVNVNINLTESQNRVKFDLVDLTGRVVARLGAEDQVIPAGDYRMEMTIPATVQPGFYLLRISSDGWQRTEKLVVE